MKKILIAIAFVASTVAMSSCSKENVTPKADKSDLGTYQDKSDLGTYQ